MENYCKNNKRDVYKTMECMNSCPTLKREKTKTIKEENETQGKVSFNNRLKSHLARMDRFYADLLKHLAWEREFREKMVGEYFDKHPNKGRKLSGTSCKFTSCNSFNLCSCSSSRIPFKLPLERTSSLIRNPDCKCCQCPKDSQFSKRFVCNCYECSLNSCYSQGLFKFPASQCNFCCENGRFNSSKQGDLTTPHWLNPLVLESKDEKRNMKQSKRSKRKKEQENVTTSEDSVDDNISGSNSAKDDAIGKSDSEHDCKSRKNLVKSNNGSSVGVGDSRATGYEDKYVQSGLRGTGDEAREITAVEPTLQTTRKPLFRSTAYFLPLNNIETH